ncbi:MAG TPA: MipA/OmpV family protein [Sphingomicrobium sp.]|nr:MipA/OmpV family protein [Sphingomicrobium sp.]
MPSAEDVANRDTITVAGGVATVPDYVGSNDYRLIPAVAVRGKVSGFSFTTRGTYLYFDAIPHRGANKVEFNLGPVAGLRLNRTNRVKDPVVKLLPRLNKAIEVGGFAGVSFHGLIDPYDTLGLRLDVLHDIGNAHRSTTFSPNLEFSTPVSRTTYVSANLGAELVSNKFADYYFGISPADSLHSGLPVFNPKGGMKDWKAGLLVNQSITGDLLGGLSVFGTVQYSRLVGDFRRSPIVSQRGSPNQWLAAAGLAYSW